MKAYMGLTCKSGAYNEVLKKLLFSLHIDQQNVFLLFGPVDILVQFNEIKDLDDFVQNWFNKVKMIGAEENLLTKTLSLIVISEGRLPAERPFAFLFLNAQPKNLENVQKSLLEFPEVLSADTVFGPYDVICAVKANDNKDLQLLISQIQKEIPQIQGTTTAIVASLY